MKKTATLLSISVGIQVELSAVKLLRYLTQIRISAQKSSIEQDRYKNIPTEQRVCNICVCIVIGGKFIIYLCAVIAFLHNKDKLLLVTF